MANHTVNADQVSSFHLPSSGIQRTGKAIKPNRATEGTGYLWCWGVEEIINAGYGVVTVYCGDRMTTTRENGHQIYHETELA